MRDSFAAPLEHIVPFDGRQCRRSMLEPTIPSVFLPQHLEHLVLIAELVHTTSVVTPFHHRRGWVSVLEYPFRVIRLRFDGGFRCSLGCLLRRRDWAASSVGPIDRFRTPDV